MDVNYGALPEHMRFVAQEYVEEGKLPGSFLQAVLRNDLYGAFNRADDINRANMAAWASFLSQIPMCSWGSVERIKGWVARKGLMAMRSLGEEVEG